jgi:uncharacterized membrane protein YjjP (DUF1212 family)
MVADRRRSVASFRQRRQIIWAAAALLTVVGAAAAVAQTPTGIPTETSTTTASASPTPDDQSPTPGDQSPTPGGTSSVLTPPATPTATTAESLTPTGAPPSTPSEPPTPSGSPTSASAQPESPPPQRPATPAASSTGAVPLSSVLIALAVLILVSLVLLRLARKGEGQVPQPEAAQRRSGTEPATDVLVLLASAGEALIDSGFDVDDVDTNLEEIARAYGMADTEIIALPTALLVSSGTGGRLRTRAVTSGRQRLRLHQIEELDDVVRVARTGRIDPRWAHDQIVAIRTRPPPFGPSMQVLGQVLATVGLAVLLGSSWLGIVVAAGLGGLTGALLLAGSRVPPRFQVLLTVAASFSVSLVVFLLSRTGLDFDVAPSLIAPLVTLLPGALLTTSVIELATGQMISGAGRLAAGAAQLVLLGLGILAAGALVGVPAFDLTATKPALGVLGPWLAVGVFGVGIVMNLCARPSSLGWILLVLYVAYGGQVLGGLFFGGVLSAFVGAAVMTPVADLVARQRTGPPAIVSFTPAFWLLVPGALGLVGVAALLNGDSAGTTTLITTVETMVAIALGVLVGRAISIIVSAREGRGGPPADNLEVTPRHALPPGA